MRTMQLIKISFAKEAWIVSVTGTHAALAQTLNVNTDVRK